MTSTRLKILALICMLLDHIWRFMPDMPYIFYLIGRISAPIFIFCCVLGFENTTSKKKYMIRIYLFSVFMGIVNLFLPIEMNFIKTLSVITIIIAIIYLFEQKNKYAKICLYTFVLWQCITSISIFMASSINYEWRVLIATILGNILYVDGGIVFIVIGILMYVFRNDNKKMIISFLIVTVFYIFLYNTDIIYIGMRLLHRKGFLPTIRGDSEIYFYAVKAILGIHPAFNATHMIYGNAQWMMIFSIPFIFKYNGERGKSLKYLFYIFYPVHIIILYLIGINIG